MKYSITIFLLALIAATFANEDNAEARHRHPRLQTVEHLDINRYLGKWYEIASFPQRFSRGCVGSTATYSLKRNGKIKVFNECRLNTLDGRYKSATGTAWRPNRHEPGKLKVRFFWPFSAKYWVIDLADDYSYAVVGHPNRKYLWILSRTPQMDARTYEDILIRVKNMHYDLTKLKLTPQPRL